MNLEVLQENPNGFKAVKGLVLLDDYKTSSELPWVRIPTYRRDQFTDFFPGCIDLAGGNRDEFDIDIFHTFQREVDEEFGIPVRREDVLYAQAHNGQPRDDDKLVLPSLFVVAKVIQPAGIEFPKTGEGNEHQPMVLADYLQRKDTIPQQVERVLDFMVWASKADLDSSSFI